MKPLKGREKEFDQIRNWIVQAAKSGQPLAIYISGSPGTGKTATMRLILESLGSQICSAVINCVSVKTQSELISAILSSQKNENQMSMDPKAIELCARKVAAMSGDLRSALHIFRQTQYNSQNILLVLTTMKWLDFLDRVSVCVLFCSF
uniref:AAA_16 domain-containing protein n=1 Tax=Heterorhabditis bacteriophora TaxID=37862 RepID=A0A1I7WU05_HETBA